MQLEKFPTRADLCKKPDLPENPWSVLLVQKTSPAYNHALVNKGATPSSDHTILNKPNSIIFFFQCTPKNIQDVKKPPSTYFLQTVLGDPIQSFIKRGYTCARTGFSRRDIFIAVPSGCSAFPHLYRERCCLHLDADLQVNENTGQGVADERLEYDSYLKRLTFLLLCHRTL